MSTSAQEARRPASFAASLRGDTASSPGGGKGRADARAVQRAALRDLGASARAGEESEESFEYVLEGLELVKRKKPRLVRRDAEQLCQLGLDLKPYFLDKTLAEWEQRIGRLEQKANVLAPELVALSMTLHERALELVHTKLKKYLAVESRMLDLVAEAKAQAAPPLL